MFCTKCGATIEDHSTFCTNCGEKIESEMNSNTPFENCEKQIATKKKKPVNKKQIGIICAPIILVVILIIVFAVINGRVSAGNYINDEIPFNGYEGYASVSVDDVFNYNELLDDLGTTDYADTKLGFLNELIDKGSDFIAEDMISISFDKAENLKNGDKITATVVVNYGAINALKFDKKLVGKNVYEKTYTVKGLEEAQVIDPFEIIDSVNYDTTDGTSSLSYNNEYNKDFGAYSARYSKSEYDSSPALEIVDSDKNTIVKITYSSNGDAYSSTKKVTVNTSMSTDEYMNKGIVIEPVKKEFEPLTCDYLRKADDLNKDDFNKIKEKAVQEIQNEQSDGKLQRVYFLYDAEETDPNADTNVIIFMYSFTASYSGKTYYSGKYITNLKINTDKKAIGIDELRIHDFSSRIDSLDDYDKMLRGQDWTIVSTIEFDK